VGQTIVFRGLPANCTDLRQVDTRFHANGKCEKPILAVLLHLLACDAPP
jgi:hypothetical protein